MKSTGNPIIGVIVKGGQNPRPQNQSIVNTSKSNVKEHSRAAAAAPVDQSIVNTTKSNTKD